MKGVALAGAVASSGGVVHDRQLLERDRRPMTGEQMLGGVLAALEPGVLDRAGRREPGRWVPVEAACDEVDELVVVAVAERRVEGPRAGNAAHLAAPRLARRQLADAAHARSAAVPARSTTRTHHARGRTDYCRP